ncbi:unnamed protein product [Pleuronectes platessa]|uniref:Uncharacterized protein n=1 Tax=Pleuronectes platessa TaxID=8262 RepID=A0A9N7V7M6_PLEPL|nr:unnamed protein product [Pleuronectes platessa]
MCWCLHFSLLTGSICCSTIETVLDRLGVRDSGSFLHIWQRLALLPVTSISTCFSNFINPHHHLCGPRPLTDPCCAPNTPTSALRDISANVGLQVEEALTCQLSLRTLPRPSERHHAPPRATRLSPTVNNPLQGRGRGDLSLCPKPRGGHNVSQQQRPADEPVGLLGHSFVIMTYDPCRPMCREECRRCLPSLRLMVSSPLSPSKEPIKQHCNANSKSKESEGQVSGAEGMSF